MKFNKFVSKATPGVQGLHPYVPGKPVEALERELGLTRVIKLASNENSMGPCPAGQQAAANIVSGVNYYPDDLGFRLRAKLSAKLSVPGEAVTLGSGSSDIIDMTARAFLSAGRNAVFSRHSFAMYAIYTQASGAELRIAEALPADHDAMPFGHDLDAMAKLIDENTRVVFIANPNNPTGTWLVAEPLKAFISNVPEDCIVLLDEAYFEFVEQEDYPNGLDWLDDFPNLLVTRTFSKIYGLAGLRVGYGISSVELAATINRVRAPFNVNNLALAAAEAALDDDEFIATSVANNRTGLAQLRGICDQQGLQYLPSAGNFLCVDFARPALPLFEALQREGVIVRPVANYQLPNHLRITIGNPAENRFLAAALERVLTA